MLTLKGQWSKPFCDGCTYYIGEVRFAHIQMNNRKGNPYTSELSLCKHHTGESHKTLDSAILRVYHEAELFVKELHPELSIEHPEADPFDAQ